MTDVDILLAAVRAQARVLKLPTVGHDCDPLARQALAEAWPLGTNVPSAVSRFPQRSAAA